MKKIIAVLEWSKEGYGVWFEDYPNVFSFGETAEQAKANACEALQFSFEGQASAPEWLSDFEIEVKFDTAGLLNYYQHIFTKRALSEITGINASLLSQYAMGLKKPRPTQSRKIEAGLHRLANELQRVTLL